MFIAVIMTVCMLADTSQCYEEQLTFEAQGTVAQCTMAAMPHIAEWAQTHPKWRVTRWRCAIPGSEGRTL